MDFDQEAGLTARARLREEVENILTTELRLALDRFQSAASALEQEVAAASAASDPERSVRLEQAQQAKAAATGELQRALRRHNRFILDREVPGEPGSTPGPDPGAAPRPEGTEGNLIRPPRYRQASASD